MRARSILFAVLLGAGACLALPVTAQVAAGSSTGPVVVSGVVPDESTRQAILTRVREVYPNVRVVDQLGVAPTSSPPNWSENVRKLINPDLRGVHRGHLKVSGNTVELVGETDSAATRDKIGSRITASLNPTYTVQNRLQAGEPVQARIDELLAGKIVEFESGSAVLSPVGTQVLDELLALLKGAENQKILVTGHTDASGPRLPNVALSRARAEAVRTYLVGRGLSAANLQTQGVGPDQPLVGNDTPEGRAKNRRIEFKVLN